VFFNPLIVESTMEAEQMSVSKSVSGTTGLVLHRAFGYDLIVWLFTRGRERAFREKLVDLARVESGESVLDVGCGTGSLAIAVARHVGSSGLVCGIDASPEMIARATAKARKANVKVNFTHALAETLPFPDRHFDVVLSTVMLHHLPRKARQQCVTEMRRVLKPEGRVLAVDFSRPEHKGGFLAHLHRRHGHVDPPDLLALLSDAGLRVTANGQVGIGDLHFALAQPLR
jgi:ubiquinone/menaquinone biosynthesis C-methylase UbiE